MSLNVALGRIYFIHLDDQKHEFYPYVRHIHRRFLLRRELRKLRLHMDFHNSYRSKSIHSAVLPLFLCFVFFSVFFVENNKRQTISGK